MAHSCIDVKLLISSVIKQVCDILCESIEVVRKKFSGF